MQNNRISRIVGSIVLDGQDANRLTRQKSIALKSAMVALELDKLLEKAINTDDLLALKNYKFKSIRAFEKHYTKELEDEGLLRKKPKLISCDINYYTAGVEALCYTCDKDFYKREVEILRADMLKPGCPGMRTIIIFTLLREAGAVHDLFSIKEQEEISTNLNEIRKDKVLSAILDLDFHSSLSSLVSKVIKTRNNLFKNPYLQGVAMIFPFFDRRESIFIDTIVLGTKFQDRQDNIVAFLQERGFDSKKCVLDGLSLIQIDNMLYRTWSSSRTFKLPIQGMVIQPYYS